MSSLRRLMLAHKLMLSYSWAGDGIPYKKACPNHDPHRDDCDACQAAEQTRQNAQQAFMTASLDDREAAYEELKKEVMPGEWWKTYKGKLLGAVSYAVQAGRRVTVVGIQGGPITTLEQREMAAIIDFIKAALVQQGLTPDIEIDVGIPTYQRFVEKYRLPSI